MLRTKVLWVVLASVWLALSVGASWGMGFSRLFG